MIEQSQLKNILSKEEYTRLEKIFICMACDVNHAKQVKDIRSLAVSSGLRAAAKWNISQILSDSGELAVRVAEGWELTLDGRKRVSEIVGPFAASPIPVIASNLRQYLPNLSDEDTKQFVEEAIECFETRKYRAAVVLSWIGAVSVLQKHVVSNCLNTFNAEATRRDARWKRATTADDLSRMKESEFLNILERLSVIGRNVKQELEGCLRFRNGCGHPNSLRIGETRVSAHIEVLILNVFSRFSV